MNRVQKRRAKVARTKGRAKSRSITSSVKPGTLLWFAVIGAVAGTKDAFGPFQALVTYMSAHWWMFPAGWLSATFGHWLLVGPETTRQRDALRSIRERKSERR